MITRRVRRQPPRIDPNMEIEDKISSLGGGSSNYQEHESQQETSLVEEMKEKQAGRDKAQGPSDFERQEPEARQQK
jgi:hypothetical protein